MLIGKLFKFLLKRYSPEIYREHELNVMRRELADLKTRQFVEACAMRPKQFAEKTKGCDSSALRTLCEEWNTESNRSSAIVQQEINEIFSMNEGDVRQLYCATFNRWHPIGFEER